MKKDTEMYMDHTHPDAFLDLPKQEPYVKWNLTKECPKCKGHGYWNLVLNDYPNSPNPADRHFKQLCGVCFGHGYVDPKANVCDHDWSDRVTIGRCLHRVTCSKCGKSMEIDSSG